MILVWEINGLLDAWTQVYSLNYQAIAAHVYMKKINH